jgi:UDP-3-O-[3-hydroxymyristoyl] glucosamine N-acyltransferase
MNLNIDLKTIIGVIGVTDCHIDAPITINRIASLENAGPNDIAVILDRGDQSVFGAVQIEKIKKSNAGFLITSSPVVEGKKYLVVKDELLAFSKLVDFAEKTERDNEQKVTAVIDPSAFVHASAVVEDGAVIGKDAVIGAQVFVGRHAVIGAGVVLYPGAKILDRCIVGDYSIIHAGAVIGSDGFGYKVTKHGMLKIPQIGIVRIGKQSEIGANCTIDRASFDETIIGNGVKLDNNVHIAHNVKIGDACAILAHTGIAGSTSLGVGCQIGGLVAIKDNLVLGNGVKVVSKSGVMNNLEDGVTVAGVPAVPFIQWKRSVVAMGKLPEIVKQADKLKSFFEQRAASPSLIQRIKNFFS